MNNLNNTISFVDTKSMNIMALAPQIIYENKVFCIKPEIIKIGSDEYTFYKKIAFGTYGHVYSYCYYKNKIAIKISEDINDLYSDIMVINHLKKKNCHDIVVESFICDYEYKIRNEIYSTKIIVMDYYDGNLLDFVHGMFNNMDVNLKHEFILNIMKQIIISIKCLLNNDLYYADITPNNILYKIISFHSVKIFLGDLGSALPINDIYTVSFPSIKNKLSDGLIKNISEYDLIWSICVTMMYLLVDKKEITFNRLCTIFLYKNIKNNDDEFIYNEINAIKNIILNRNMDEKIKNIYDNIFCLITKKSYDICLDDMLLVFNP